MAKNVKNTTVSWLLDLVFPHSCKGCGRLGEVLCERCKNNIICCKNDIDFSEDDLPETFVVGLREDLLANLIHEYKYNSVRALAPVFAEMMDARLPEDLTEAVLVPLPTATTHVRSRGFDHMLLIAKKLARRRSGFSVQKILTREKNTVQVGADNKKREAQARKAYGVNPKIEIDPEKTYVLLDDVLTTGASARAAVLKMRKAGAKKVILSLLATSPSRSRSELSESQCSQ